MNSLKPIIICLIALLLLSTFCFAKTDPIEEKQIGDTAVSKNKNILQTLWEKILLIFENIINWLKNIWNHDIQQKHIARFKNEFQEESREMIESIKNDLPSAFKDLWIKIKTIVK